MGREQWVENIVLVLAEFHQDLAESLGFLQRGCPLARCSIPGDHPTLVLQIRLQLGNELSQVPVEHNRYRRRCVAMHVDESIEGTLGA